MSLAFPVSSHRLATSLDDAILSQFVGTRVHWRLLDPIGGMVLSLYIIVEWIKTLAENFAKRESNYVNLLREGRIGSS